MSSVPQRNEEQDASTGVTDPGSGSSLSLSSKGRTAIAGAMVTASVTLCFFLLFWNRFLGLRSGDGGFSGAVFFLKGILPYRDYYLPVPPLWVVRCAAVLAIFGKLPIVLRGYAVFERVFLSLLLYGWLVRFFRVKDAAWAAIVTMVVSAGDYADPVSSYNHFTIMLAIAGGFTASYALDAGRTKRTLAAIGCAAGVISLLCLAAKQTIGLGVTLAIPLAVGLCLIRLEGFPKAMRFLAGFAAGWSLAAVVSLGWMVHFGILRAFLTQAFVTGPAAKAAHPGDFLVHTLVTLRDYWWAALIALFVLAVCWGALRRSENEEKKDTDTDSLKGILLALLLGLGIIGASSMQPLPFRPDMAAKPTIYISLIGSGLLSAYYCWRYLSGGISRRQSQFALIASVAFIAAFMTSLSYPAFEAMTIPWLGLFLALLLNDFDRWRRWVVYAVCGVLLCCETQFKERAPFGFNGWQEPPVKLATMKSSLPEYGDSCSRKTPSISSIQPFASSGKTPPQRTRSLSIRNLGSFMVRRDADLLLSPVRITLTWSPMLSQRRKLSGCSEFGRQYLSTGRRRKNSCARMRLTGAMGSAAVNGILLLRSRRWHRNTNSYRCSGCIRSGTQSMSSCDPTRKVPADNKARSWSLHQQAEDFH